MLQIAESINRKIRAHQHWHVSQNVIATVDDKQQAIKLSGRVISWHQRQLAHKIALEETQPHIKIIDSIEVA